MEVGGACEGNMWRNQAHENLNKNSYGKVKSPYFSSYSNDGSPISDATGTSIFGDQSETAELARKAAQMATTSNNNPEGAEFDPETGVDSSAIWGIQRSYSGNTPPAERVSSDELQKIQVGSSIG